MLGRYSFGTNLQITSVCLSVTENYWHCCNRLTIFSDMRHKRSVSKDSLQCTYDGCKATLSTIASRLRHESSCCYRPDLAPEVTMKEQYPVPSHHELGIPSTHCRKPSCLKTFSNDASRKKHEVDKHRYVEVKGRTVSPIRFDAGDLVDPFVRPPSCPSLQADDSGIQLKRRRTVSASQVTFSGSSDLSTQSILRFSSLTNLHCERLGESFEAGENQCPFCLFQFQNTRTLKQHDQCHFQPAATMDSETTILVRPKNWKKTYDILSQLRETIQNNSC